MLIWIRIRKVHPHFEGCRIVSKTGDPGSPPVVLECGHVGCCDSSKNKHATETFSPDPASGRPFVRAGRIVGWCYVDRSCWNSPDGGPAPAGFTLVGRRPTLCHSKTNGLSN